MNPLLLHFQRKDPSRPHVHPLLLAAGRCICTASRRLIEGVHESFPRRARKKAPNRLVGGQKADRRKCALEVDLHPGLQDLNRCVDAFETRRD